MSGHACTNLQCQNVGMDGHIFVLELSRFVVFMVTYYAIDGHQFVNEPRVCHGRVCLPCYEWTWTCHGYLIRWMCMPSWVTNDCYLCMSTQARNLDMRLGILEGFNL
eukprot:1159261-Pelagomonas_calceolata.AAC.6